jgi:hypothetical protein
LKYRIFFESDYSEGKKVEIVKDELPRTHISGPELRGA